MSETLRQGNKKFGKLAPKLDYKTLRLTNYLDTSVLAPPPPSWENLDQVYKNLGIKDPRVLFPIDGNDQYGDCTIAGIAHAETVYNGLIGKKLIPTAKEVTDLYFKIGDGQDNGLAELDVLKYVAKNGALGSLKILGYVRINPANTIRVKQAIRLFGGVYVGFQVQANAQQDFENHIPWTPGTLTEGGHAVYVTGYDDKGVNLLTWGDTQRGTWDWWKQCMDECYAILPHEAQQPNFEPGFNFNQLKADLIALKN